MAYAAPEQARAARAAYYQANKAKCNAASRAWALANADRRREIERKYEGANKAKTAQKAKRWNDANRELNKVKRQLSAERHPEKLLLKNARSRAKKYGHLCTISAADIQIPDRCPIRGVLFKRGVPGNCPDAPSLDRLDSQLGYVPGNVWVISYRANTVKNDGTPEEHEQIAAAVRLKFASKQ